MAVLCFRGVGKKRITTVGRVRAASVVVKRIKAVAVLLSPSVLLTRADAPLAVLSSPTVLLKRANAPFAVLKPPVVLLKSAPAPVAVLLSAPLAKSAPAPMAVLKLLSVLLLSTRGNQLLY